MAMWLAATCVLLSAFLPGRQPMWKLFSPKFYSAPAFATLQERTGALDPILVLPVDEIGIYELLRREAA